MRDLKEQLIRLGNTNPELRPNLKKILDTLHREASMARTANFEFGGTLYRNEHEAAQAALDWYYAGDEDLLLMSDREIAQDLSRDRDGKTLTVNMNDGRTPAFRVMDYLKKGRRI